MPHSSSPKSRKIPKTIRFRTTLTVFFHTFFPSEIPTICLSGKSESRRLSLRLYNKKRGEENEKEILKLCTYIITVKCEKNK